MIFFRNWLIFFFSFLLNISSIVVIHFHCIHDQVLKTNGTFLFKQDMDFPVYKGPKLAAEAVRSFFDKSKNDALILDVACGSGKVGHEVKPKPLIYVDSNDTHIVETETTLF